jgi:hypothetical protein
MERGQLRGAGHQFLGMGQARCNDLVEDLVVNLYIEVGKFIVP